MKPYNLITLLVGGFLSSCSSSLYYYPASPHLHTQFVKAVPYNGRDTAVFSVKGSWQESKRNYLYKNTYRETLKTYSGLIQYSHRNRIVDWAVGMQGHSGNYFDAHRNVVQFPAKMTFKSLGAYGGFGANTDWENLKIRWLSLSFFGMYEWGSYMDFLRENKNLALGNDTLHIYDNPFSGLAMLTSEYEWAFNSKTRVGILFSLVSELGGSGFSQTLLRESIALNFRYDRYVFIAHLSDYTPGEILWLGLQVDF